MSNWLIDHEDDIYCEIDHSDTLKEILKGNLPVDYQKELEKLGTVFKAKKISKL